jgi:hypothetical protein
MGEQRVDAGAGRVRPVTYGVLGILAGLVIGYGLHPPSRTVTRAAAAPACVEVAKGPEPITKSVLAQPQVQATPREAPMPPQASSDAEAMHRRSQSKALMQSLGARLKIAKLAPHATSPEATANEVELYLAGWSDAIMRGSPELIDEMAAEIEREMCEPGAEDAALVVLSRAAARMPDVANARGLECILARGREDFVLWTALDAWSASAQRLGESAVLARVEQSARDERTTQRLTAIRTPPGAEPPE